jgi:two-component system, chemotaxis family, CheB/CheR fusion protein
MIGWYPHGGVRDSINSAHIAMASPSIGGAHSPTSRSTPVVGLGASAGGLLPLEQFLARAPPRSGFAYIVVQHMDPTHKTMLRELLQRVTAMPVLDAAESMRVEPDTVYVIPPNTELTLVGGVLHLAHPVKPRGNRLPIVLFRSLARDQGERAIGVVLSGMGSDGMIGLQAIKTQGGLTLAQQPETAQFDSMPCRAIAAGCVDIVAPPAELPERILGVVNGPSAKSLDKVEQHASPLSSILDLLQERTKHDLTLYKTSTLMRRIERRVAVQGLPTMAAYEAFLRQNPQELDLLFKEMLIGVTGFFRDANVWQQMRDAVLPTLLSQHKVSDYCLRAWVVGCSTGEEAYSLAMIFKEVAESLPEHAPPRLQIFATDLSLDAIAHARRGHYPARSVSNVTAERLARFFSAQADGYRIAKSVREMVLFTQHDVILDPPFTRLDILSCRNLLIYFTPQLQRRLLPLFHYSLRPGGVLMLGEAETAGSAERMFRPLDRKSRLYWRSRNHSRLAPVHFPTRSSSSSSASQEYSMSKSGTSPPNLQSLADQVVLQVFSPPAVLINAAGDVLYISGRIGRYLEPGVGKANWNVHVMARPGIRIQLAAALRTALHDKQPVELRGLRVEDDALEASAVDITVQAIHEPRELEGMVMIVFRDVAIPRGRRKSAKTDSVAGSDELLRARAEIRALRQEMRASQEQLQATNEALQSINEELQSANEELTSSKEEAQSMNEELQTINAELQSKLDDLALAQSDMQNLLNSTNIATLFLDRELRVRRFTEQVTRIIPLRDGDIGRPLSDLASKLLYSALPADANETLRSLAACEKEIRTTDGHWFSVRIMPYRTVTDVIGGVVMTFVDISTAKELEARLRKAPSGTI